MLLLCCVLKQVLLERQSDEAKHKETKEATQKATKEAAGPKTIPKGKAKKPKPLDTEGLSENLKSLVENKKGKGSKPSRGSVAKKTVVKKTVVVKRTTSKASAKHKKVDTKQQPKGKSMTGGTVTNPRANQGKQNSRCNHGDVANFKPYDNPAYAEWPNILAGKICSTCKKQFKHELEDCDSAANTFVPGKGRKTAWGCPNCAVMVEGTDHPLCSYCLCSPCGEVTLNTSLKTPSRKTYNGIY